MESLNKLQKGNEVITIGGLYGTIDEVDTDRKTVVLMLMVSPLTLNWERSKQFFLYQKESQLLRQKVLAQMLIQPSKNNHQRRGKGLFWWANRTM